MLLYCCHTLSDFPSVYLPSIPSYPSGHFKESHSGECTHPWALQQAYIRAQHLREGLLSHFEINLHTAKCTDLKCNQSMHPDLAYNHVTKLPPKVRVSSVPGGSLTPPLSVHTDCYPRKAGSPCSFSLLFKNSSIDKAIFDLVYWLYYVTSLSL